MSLTLLSGCNKFLDETPDNRTEVDTPAKIAQILTSAYPDKAPCILNEISSDNIDKRQRGPTIVDRENMYDQIANWKDVTETTRESPEDVWEACYLAIAHANMGLEAIEELGNPASLRPQRGEALMCRAFAHFLLVNTFARHIDDETGEQDMGVVYMDHTETAVSPTYHRESVADNYRRMQADIEEALPLIDNGAYSQPKFHFNRSAAYAFATRFYLYTRQYDKVIACANEVLGENPGAVMRDMSGYPVTGIQTGSVPKDADNTSKYYVEPGNPGNLLILPLRSYLGYVFQNRSYCKWYSQSPYLAFSEGLKASGPWGLYSASTFYIYITGNTATDASTSQYLYQSKFPEYFVNSNHRSEWVPFTTGETLLCRAEAYIMKEDYTHALQDLALWMKTWTTVDIKLTDQLINDTYGDMPHYTPTNPTPKKRLGVQLASEKQENYIDCCLQFRRFQTWDEGLRWMDIKRWKITIYRRYIADDTTYNVDTGETDGTTPQILDTLTPDDPRVAIQLPQSVIRAGLEPNPR